MNERTNEQWVGWVWHDEEDDDNDDDDEEDEGDDDEGDDDDDDDIFNSKLFCPSGRLIGSGLPCADQTLLMHLNGGILISPLFLTFLQVNKHLKWDDEGE